MNAGGLLWFARHEARLALRDFRLLSRGGRWGGAALLIGLAVVLHLVAAAIMRPDPGLAAAPTRQLLLIVTGMLAMSGALMVSQAIESVTRTFYTRGDLDLILSSPATAWKLFAVRIATMAMTLATMSLALSAAFINLQAWRGGARWLALYPVVAALAMLAVAVGITATAGLFRLIGAERTRLVAQIASAFIGASFAVGLQVAAIQSFGTPDRLALLRSDSLMRLAPDEGSAGWGLAYAAMGYPLPLAMLIVVATAALGSAIAVYAPRFATYVQATAGIAERHGGGRLRGRSAGAVLRAKEWALLRRDPWLVSQTLVQLLYLMPPAYLLWLTFSGGLDVVAILVPVLVTAGGQFAGGLAWLAISGEDAPDLIATAPIPAGLEIRAKFEATVGGTLMVFGPFLLGVAIASPWAGVVATIGIALAAAGATAIQYWYRLQATRGRIRRRQTASRFTTYAEALSSIAWAGSAAMAVEGNRLALVLAGLGGIVLLLAWLLRPASSRR
jgi:ABC-2 type transport system permease protein